MALRIGFVLLALLAPAASAQLAPVDIGVLPGGDFSVALDINDLGEIVGRARTLDTATQARVIHAFLWRPGEGMVDMGTFGGTSSLANAINNLGHVAGQASTGSENHPFLWTPESGMIDLGVLGSAEGLNDAGQIVGWADFGGGGQQQMLRAFLWTASDGMSELGTLGGAESTAFAINELGDVAGSAETASGESHAFLWTASGGMIDLGTLGGADSFGLGINDQGHVVGVSETDTGESHTFLWTPEGGMTSLGGPLLDPFQDRESLAYAINDRGEVVGRAENASHRFGGYRWTDATGREELPTLGGAYGEARGVNGRGQIVGSSRGSDNQRHATLWIEPFAIVTVELPAGERDVGYSARLEAIGGLGTPLWSLAGGSLPAGLSLDPVTGELAGTPTEAGDFDLTVTAVDAFGDEATVELLLTIADIAGDQVTITRAVWRSAQQMLQVLATSSAGGGVVLSVVDFGDLFYVPSLDVHRRAFQGVADNPVEITVISSGGGSATAQVTVQ